MARLGVVGRAEAQRIEVGDGARAHGEHVAHDAADAGRRALVGLDVARVVVALHLEDDGPAVAHVDDARVLARPLDDQGPARRQRLQPVARRLIGAVLAPHDREDPELGKARLASEDLQEPCVLLRRQPMLRHDLGRDGGSRLGRCIHAEKLISPGVRDCAYSGRIGACRLGQDVRLPRLASDGLGAFQVFDEAHKFALARSLVGEPQEVGRVDRNPQVPRLALDRLPAHPPDGDGAPHQRGRGRRPERNRQARAHEGDLLVEPPAAGFDLARVGLLMQSALAARLVLEVLDRVGDVDLRPVDAGRFERLIENLPCRADERAPGEILPVAWLLADEHHLRRSRAFAEHGLGSVAPQRTAPACRRVRAQVRQVGGDVMVRSAWQLHLLRFLGKETSGASGRSANTHPEGWEEVPTRDS